MFGKDRERITQLMQREGTRVRKRVLGGEGDGWNKIGTLYIHNTVGPTRRKHPAGTNELLCGR